MPSVGLVVKPLSVDEPSSVDTSQGPGEGCVEGQGGPVAWRATGCHRPSTQGAQPDCRPPLPPRTRGCCHPLVSSGTLSQMRQVPSVLTSPTLPRPGSQLPAWVPSSDQEEGTVSVPPICLCPSRPEPPASRGAGHMPTHNFPDRTGWHSYAHARTHARSTDVILTWR